jgi:DNA-binding MarR family transcriptional regulator
VLADRATLAFVQATDASAQVSPKELAELLLGLWHHLMRGSSQELYTVLTELDLSLPHVKTLHVLADSEQELSVKEAGERLGLSLPGASRVVDTLLRRGFLSRREDAHDRRVKRVRITPEGLDVVRRIDGARLVGLEAYTRDLTAGQRATLAAALRDLPHRSAP